MSIVIIFKVVRCVFLPQKLFLLKQDDVAEEPLVKSEEDPGHSHVAWLSLTLRSAPRELNTSCIGLQLTSAIPNTSIVNPAPAPAPSRAPAQGPGPGAAPAHAKP